MKLIYFVGPYDLLDAKEKSAHTLTEDSKLIDLSVYLTWTYKFAEVHYNHFQEGGLVYVLNIDIVTVSVYVVSCVFITIYMTCVYDCS